MRRPMTWVLRGLAGVAVILLLLVIAIAVVLNTQPGTRWAIAYADKTIPGELEIKQFSGTLWSGLRIPALDYRDASTELHIVDAELVVLWASLATGRFEVSRLTAESIEYSNLAPSLSAPEPLELALDPLPIAIEITHGRVAGLTLIAGENRTVVTNIQLDRALLDKGVFRAATASAVVNEAAVAASEVFTELQGDVPLGLSIQWSYPETGWAGSGTISGSLASLAFNHTVSGPYPGVASGEIKLLHRVEPEFDVAVSWGAWSFGDYTLEDGQAQVLGTMNDYATEYDLTLLSPVTEAVKVSGTAAGNTRQLSAFNTRVTGVVGDAELTGSLNWQPSFTAEAQVNARGLDPSAFVDALTGSLDADFHIGLGDNGDLNIADLVAAGTLNDATVVASGDIVVAAGRVRCTNCVVNVGDNHLDVDGGYGLVDDVLTFAIDAPVLNTLWPGISGRLKGEGSLSGLTEVPILAGELRGQDLRFAQWSASEVVIDSRSSTIESLDMSVAVTSLFTGETDLGSFTTTGKGAPDSLHIDLNWAILGLDIDVEGNVQRTAGLIEGVFTTANISEPNTGVWSLNEALRFQIAGDDLTLNQHNWVSELGALQVSRVSVTEDEIELVANLDDFPLRFANSFLPENFQLEGMAIADIDVKRQNGEWSGTVNWNQTDTILHVLEEDQQLTDVVIPTSELSIVLQDGGANAIVALAIEPGVSAGLELTLANLTSDSQIIAELQFSGSDWDWIPAVFPTIDNFSGAISATVNATGPLQSPEFNGSLNWRSGSLVVPSLNVPITEIDFTVAGSSAGSATIMGKARAGDGELSVDGRLEDIMLPARSVRLAFSGSGAELINWPEYHVWASPDLVVTGSSEGWEFDGKLVIPQAEIAVRELPDEAVMPSDDVIVIGREETTETRARIAGEANIVLGDEVHVTAFGLDTKLQGDLQIRMSGDRPISGEGEVTLVDGVFVAYGQKLTITQGTLTFTGPLDNPLVDVRAVRIIESLDGPITAGIHLQGRAQSINSSVFSDPTMAEADALSYLVVGRPLSQATESEGGELASAALALGVRQAGRITEQIGQALGLDQLAVAGNGGDTTALVAGKQINSRLHARYAYGVFSRLGTLLIRYRLSKRLTLEAGAGEANSIDLLYLVEKQ